MNEELAYILSHYIPAYMFVAFASVSKDCFAGVTRYTSDKKMKIVIAAGERVYIFIGLRWGGRRYNAKDDSGDCFGYEYVAKSCRMFATMPRTSSFLAINSDVAEILSYDKCKVETIKFMGIMNRESEKVWSNSWGDKTITPKKVRLNLRGFDYYKAYTVNNRPMMFVCGDDVFIYAEEPDNRSEYNIGASYKSHYAVYNTCGKILYRW